MAYLRTLGIGGCGTFRSNARGQPSPVKKELRARAKNMKAFALGDIHAWCVNSYYTDDMREKIPESSILVVSCIDRNAFKAMPTLHGATNWREDYTIRNRRRPKLSSSNAQNSRDLFGTEHRRLLPIPRVIDDYNLRMNGVDSFDQRRAAFDARLRSRRNWVAIYQFLLDIALVNTVAITRMNKWTASSKTTAEIRLEIADRALNKARQLMDCSARNESQSHEEPSVSKVPYVTKKTIMKKVLPVVRLSRGAHIPHCTKLRRRCYLCRFRNERRLTLIQCSQYVVSLCCSRERNCYARYHEPNFCIIQNGVTMRDS